ncbi:MAG TPA: complex I NDUFA9 subunit family protein [Methylophilaceae bacterium]|nr:complex I NDUFA9 subunit family protein [Methylophilaceae bacterium]
MRIKYVGVFGGSGFVGTAIVNQLNDAGYRVKVFTRRREASKHLILLPYVEVIECDVLDDVQLGIAISGCDAVVNLVGVLHESGHGSFDTLHAELPRRIALICRNEGVRRLLHMSALQAKPDAPSHYLRSKSAGEAHVLAQTAPPERADEMQVTVFRPSLIFGRGDRFLNMFAKLAKRMPFMMLARPQAKFQPIWVDDVAKAFLRSLENPDTYGQTYELCGPRIYTLRELVQFVQDILGLKRPVIGLNDDFSYWLATVMEHLPGKLITRDNLLSMKLDNVCDKGFPSVFRFQPAAMETVVPDYLSDYRFRNIYNRYRSHSGR